MRVEDDERGARLGLRVVKGVGGKVVLMVGVAIFNFQ